jgi:protein-S-isoprenylcysteine O-methyltransferase Ste14
LFPDAASVTPRSIRTIYADTSPSRRLDIARDLTARLFVGVLFALMSVNLFDDFVRTGHITGMLLLASESLVVVLTIFRRRANFTDRSVAAVTATILSLAGPPLVRPTTTFHAILPDAATALISGLGLLLVIVAKVTLGRSFGIAPANRGVVASGPYTFVRHPIYAGYIVAHIAFVLAHPSPWNLTILTIGDSALVVRALLEERLLVADGQYQSYCARVRWHVVPGLF